MKRCFIALLFLFSYLSALSTTCGPIDLGSQTDVDNFRMNNPGCDTINGNLHIHGASVVNLDSLIGLVHITGNLQIDTTSLTSLSGLEGILTAPSIITIDTNHMLLNFNALINMTSLAQISITRNVVLNDVSGLINVIANNVLVVENNPNLSTCCIFKDDVEANIPVMNIENNEKQEYSKIKFGSPATPTLKGVVPPG